MRFVPYASSAVRTRARLTSSSPSAADQWSTIGFHHLIQRLGKAAKMPFPLHPHMLRHACGYKLANDGHDTRALQHYLGHKNIQVPSVTPSSHPTGSATSGAIRLAPDPGSAHLKRAWMCVRQTRPPGRGDFWILEIAHAPSPKNLSKNGFCPRKGVAFLWKAFLQKNFQGREKIDRIDGPMPACWHIVTVRSLPAMSVVGQKRLPSHAGPRYSGR